MEEKINILLIFKNENCLTEIIDFLLYAKYQYPNDTKDLNEDEYAYLDGPPCVIGEKGPPTFRVHFILKSFDTIDSDINNINQSMYLYDAIVMFLDDKADAELISDFMRSPNYTNLPKSHSLTIIDSRSDNMNYLLNLGKVKSVDLSTYALSYWYIWKNWYACNWSTHIQKENGLWNHITQNRSRITKISYNAETMLSSIINVFDFFYQLLIITYSNINVIAGGTEANNMYLGTLTRQGDSYIHSRKQAKELFIQLNISNLSDLLRLLKEEMKQLAYPLSRLAILCDEIVNFTDDVHTQLFHNFSGLEQFRKMYYNELHGVDKKNITEEVLVCLDAMSKMKYTGIYIKDVLGIKNLNALKGFLKKPHSFKIIDSTNVPTTIVDNPFVNEEKQGGQHEKRIQNIDIENRIGNIKLLSSLQKTLQEFTEELKDMRQLKEQDTTVIAKDNRKITEKLSNLEQDNRKLQENLSHLERDNRELKEKLVYLEQKLDEASIQITQRVLCN